VDVESARGWRGKAPSRPGDHDGRGRAPACVRSLTPGRGSPCRRRDQQSSCWSPGTSEPGHANPDATRRRRDRRNRHRAGRRLPPKTPRSRRRETKHERQGAEAGHRAKVPWRWQTPRHPRFDLSAGAIPVRPARRR
jgi:hypothetical protein